MTTAPANLQTGQPSTPKEAAAPARVSPASRPAPVPAPAASRATDWWSLLTSPSTLLMLGALAAAFVLLFRHWLAGQHEHSTLSADWSHAYMVPAISLYLLWQRREAIARIKPSVFWPGMVPIVMGIWSYIYFIAGFPNHLGQGLAMLLVVFGLTLMLLGPRMMTYAFLPIGYLFFAITIPEKIMNHATWPLQILAAKGGWVGLNLLGIKTDILGNQLMVFNTATQQTVPLNVAEACSGMRMLIAFLALGGAVSLVATKMWWKRVVLLGLAAPLALLLNVIRIIVLGYASLYNAGLSTGVAHTFIGTLLLIPGFFIYIGIVVALHKAVPEGPSDEDAAKGAGKLKPAGGAA